MSQATAIKAHLTEQEPPHNLAMEQALLCALMNHEESFEEIAEIIRAEDFYGERHKIIFDSIAHLARTNNPYDTLSVFEQLERQRKTEDAGGDSYFLEIERSAGTRYNLKFYAEKVHELATYRKLITTANDILAMAHHPKKQTLGEILDRAEAQIFAINEARNRNTGTQGLKKGDDILQTVTELLEELRERPDDALLGLDTGFEELNNKTQGLQKGDLVVLAARPSMGKTALAINITQSALYNKSSVMFFSMEMSAEAIVMRLLSAWSGVNHSNLRSGKMSPDEWAKFNNGATLLADSKLYIDDRNNLSPNELRSVCRKVVKDSGEPLGLVVVDYLQLMKVTGMDGNRVGEISEISRSLKALARELSCPVLALSQLNRGLEQRPNKRPIMSDLRESGAIEQDADVIMFIYRDEVYNKERADNKGLAEIIIGKNRNGAIGKIPLSFAGQFTRFDNLTHVPEGYDSEDE